MLRIITKAEWYIRHEDIHNDLNIETVNETIKKNSKKHTNQLLSHQNSNLRLKRRTPTELNY